MSEPSDPSQFDERTEPNFDLSRGEVALVTPGFLYHAASTDDWGQRSENEYLPSSFGDEGFIHLSTPTQLLTPLHKFYLGRPDLVLLTVDHSRVSAPVVWEDLYNGGEEFPHVYGPLNLGAIIAVAPLPCDDQGRFDWLLEKNK